MIVQLDEAADSGAGGSAALLVGGLSAGHAQLVELSLASSEVETLGIAVRRAALSSRLSYSFVDRFEQSDSTSCRGAQPVVQRAAASSRRSVAIGEHPGENQAGGELRTIRTAA